MSYDTHEGLACTSPCSMYGVLLEHGIIDDPFYGLNELKYTGLSDKDCAFETPCEVDGATLEKEHVELLFLGLDTLCRIVLNGCVLDETKNMHRRYIYDVKDGLALGTNTLRLEFSSTTEYFRKMD